MAQAIRVELAPDLDGSLKDDCWQNAPVTSGMTMDRPYPGQPLEQKTEIQMVYTDEAVYIAIHNFDSAPDSIYKQLTGRDSEGNSDYCGVSFNCYRDGVTGYFFAVSPLGEQFDARTNGDGEDDETWNAVWYCKTAIVNDGWIAEFKIPFAALRFPEAAEQLWDINFVREVRRTRHHAFWNPVDPAGPAFLAQMGTVEGIKGIKPPRRIFFYPYASSYYNLSIY